MRVYNFESTSLPTYISYALVISLGVADEACFLPLLPGTWPLTANR